MAASMPSCTIRNVVISMLRSVLEDGLLGIPGNILGVYLDPSWELAWEYRVKQTQNV